MKKFLLVFLLSCTSAGAQIAGYKYSTCIEFTQADVPISASPLTLTARASSGVPVTFVTKTPAVCTVAGGVATLKLAGVCTLVAKSALTAAHMAGQTALSFAITAVLGPPPRLPTAEELFFMSCGPCPGTGKIETTPAACTGWVIGRIDPAGGDVAKNMKWVVR